MELGKQIKNSICWRGVKKSGNVKTVVNTDFLSYVVLERTLIFDNLVPKWCPDFL